MHSASSGRNPLQDPFFVIWLLAWIALLVLASLTLRAAVVGMGYPYQLDYGEGIVLWFARQLANGQSIYGGTTGASLASSNYPPLSMLLAAGLFPLLGDGYLGGRLLNLLAVWVVVGLIYVIVSGEKLGRWLGIFTALLFIASPYVHNWIPLFRADLIGLSFTFCGVFAVWEYERVVNGDRVGPAEPRQGWGWLLAAGMFFLLALYTKHTLFAGPVAAFITLFRHNRSLATAFALLIGAIGGILYLVIDLVTGGGFTFGLIDSNATVFLWEQLGRLISNFAVTFPLLIALAAIGLWHRIRSGRAGVVEWYTLASALWLVTAGRIGAWENYFFEAIAGLCIMAAFGIEALRRLLPRIAPRAVTVIPIMILLQLALFWRDPAALDEMLRKDYGANQQLGELLRVTPGPVISEDMGALVTSGKPVVYYTFQYSSLARAGKWDQSWELGGLERGQFPLVILENGTREDVDHYRRFTREFVSGLDRYYARVRAIGKYQIYAPAALEHQQRSDFGDTVALLGWSADPALASAGPVRISIAWQAKTRISARLTAFLHLTDAAGNKIAQKDQEPLAGVYPTDRWAPGEIVRDTYTLDLDRSLTAGIYSLRVGWYDSESGDRLEVQGSKDNSVLLTQFQLEK